MIFRRKIYKDEADEQNRPLHMRIIEALALAIEAKQPTSNYTTQSHLQRTRTYAVEIARELNLGEEQIEALDIAALVHDIGTLGVPEQIINRPGKLTPRRVREI